MALTGAYMRISFKCCFFFEKRLSFLSHPLARLNNYLSSPNKIFATVAKTRCDNNWNIRRNSSKIPPSEISILMNRADFSIRRLNFAGGRILLAGIQWKCEIINIARSNLTEFQTPFRIRNDSYSRNGAGYKYSFRVLRLKSFVRNIVFWQNKALMHYATAES